MSKGLHNLRLLKKNKHEFYISFLVVAAGYYHYSVWSPHYSAFEKLLNPASLLLALVIGFFCLTNALLDVKRMNWFERALAVAWLCVMINAGCDALLRWHSLIGQGVQ